MPLVDGETNAGFALPRAVFALTGIPSFKVALVSPGVDDDIEPGAATACGIVPGAPPPPAQALNAISAPAASKRV